MRPAWYFDVAVQGEGITDVTTHLVDLTQWMTGGGKPFDYARDVQLVAARQWPTEVPREIFGRITGLDDFPAAIRGAVSGDVLHYLCNAQIDYRLRGVPMRIVSLWNLAIPEGGGDTHNAILRGTQADLVVDQGRETGFATRLSVHPRSPGPAYAKALADAVAALQPQYPGLTARAGRGRVSALASRRRCGPRTKSTSPRCWRTSSVTWIAASGPTTSARI